MCWWCRLVWRIFYRCKVPHIHPIGLRLMHVWCIVAFVKNHSGLKK